MRANELMLGDWVMLTDPIHNGENVQVKEIHADDYITVDGGIVPMFEPIPLTAEILEKNGFKREPSRGIRDSINYWFILSYDDVPVRFTLFYAQGVFHWFGQLEFKYVHELQHALRLCEINKEIII